MTSRIIPGEEELLIDSAARRRSLFSREMVASAHKGSL